MYKIIIVDDEALVCDELGGLLDWHTLGLELVGTFLNGADALEFIKNNEVDIILSDIKMPRLSGIDLAKICFEQYPHIKIVLISAHRDFEYARSAIAYNVHYYILKPIIYSELENTLKQLCKSIDKEKINNTFPDNELSLLRQQFFSDFLSGMIHDTTILQSQLASVKIFYDFNCPCALLKIHIIDFTHQLINVWKYGKDRLYSAINQLIPAETDSVYASLISHTYDNIELIVLSKKAIKNFAPTINELIDVLYENLTTILNIPIKISVTQYADSLIELKKDILPDNLISNQVRTIISHLIGNNAEPAYKKIDAIFDTFSTHTDILKHFCKQLSKSLLKLINEETDEFNDDSLSTKEMYIILQNQISHFLLHTNQNNSPKCNNIISVALKYMNEHYKDDITLESVSARVMLNPIYFSTYFKNQTGEKFIDYLIRIRIEKAKELIQNEPESKIHYICESVGYKSIPHFYKVFRSYTGLTPAEYRVTCIKGGDSE